MMDNMIAHQMTQIRTREHRANMNVLDCCPERAYVARSIAAAATTPAPEAARLSAPAAIRAERVTKGYRLGKNNDVAALRGATVEIEAGEMVAIVGPSGSGKSTLMHILGCLDTPDTGTVHIGGTRVDNLKGRELTKVRSRTVGFIFQGFNLIPTLSAVDNVALAAEYAGRLAPRPSPGRASFSSWWASASARVTSRASSRAGSSSASRSPGPS